MSSYSQYSGNDKTELKRIKDSQNFSHSLMKEYQKCPRRYREVYIKGNREEAPHFRIGTAVHEAIHNYFEGNIEENQVKDFLWKTLVVDSEVETCEDEYKEAVKIVEKTGISDIIEKLDLSNYNFHSEFLMQTEVEGKNYKGIADLIMHYYENENLDDTSVIVDFKTSKNPTYVDWGQFDFYALLASLMYNSLGVKEPSVYHFKIYFLRHNLIKQRKVMSKDIPSIRESIFSCKKELDEDFNFYPKKNRWCDYCFIKNTCPLFVDVI